MLENKCDGCLSELCLRCPNYTKRTIIQEIKSGATYVNHDLMIAEFTSEEVEVLERIIAQNLTKKREEKC